jgi:hypothetical protein
MLSAGGLQDRPDRGDYSSIGQEELRNAQRAFFPGLLVGWETWRGSTERFAVMRQ